jgi:hypothetical protein
VGRDPSHDLAVALGEEVLGLGVVKERVLVAIEELAALHDQRRDPGRAAVEPRRQLDEGAEVALSFDRPDRHAWHGRGSYWVGAGGGVPTR